MSRRSGARWYGFMASWSGPKGVAQIEAPIQKAERVGRSSMLLPEPILRLAQDEYDRQFPGQPYERMQERGGLGLLEIIALLADRIERTLSPQELALGIPLVRQQGSSDGQSDTSLADGPSTLPESPIGAET